MWVRPADFAESAGGMWVALSVAVKAALLVSYSGRG